MTPEATWSPTVYEEVRRLAEGLMAGERAGHTLEPTALVNEVWLRLFESRNAGALDRGAFLGLAAQAMRRVLTDHARRRATAKRGGGLRRTTLDGRVSADGSQQSAQDLALDLDAALAALEQVDSELVRIVELRFYGGASIEEVARTLGLSARTLKRRWRFARAWLQQHMLESDA